MSEDYLNNNELKNIHGDYNFAEQMQHDSINQLWRNKTGLWTLLSAACNDTAQECFEHIQNYTNKLIDIETCDIHSLKSIAKSVNLDFLTKNIKENYPCDVLKLINLLSVPRHLLLNSNILLHSDANIKIFGEITKRSSLINVDSVSIELLLDIKKNIISLSKILNNCSLFGSYTILKLLKYDLPDLLIKNINKQALNINLNYDDENNKNLIYEITLNDIIEFISELRDNDLKKYKKQTLMTSDNKINYFYLLINVIKQNFYNKETNVFIDGFYFNRNTNKIEDHSNLIMRIVSSIYYDNDSYINDFICYHFYNLFKSKLFNNSLKMLYSYDDVSKIFVMNKNIYISEYSEDEFKEELRSYISDEIIDEFIEKNNITIYVKSILSFAEYMSFINLYNGLNNRNNDVKEFEYDVISLNFYEKNDKRINKNLYYEIIESRNGINSAILNIAKELSDIVIHISYLREDVKNNIQKYGIIGTKKIVLDNLTEFFIKNYSNNKDWSYQSNFIINHYEDYISSLFSSTSNIISKDENNFSINLIEYYDTTDYLNIESDLGNVKIGNEIIGYEDSPSFYLDEDNLIASAFVKNPIYRDVYAPCSNFVDNFNKKFWENDSFTYLVNNDKLINDIQYYEQYFDECQDKISINDKNIFINSTIIPFIEKIWDEYALSGYSELSKNDEIGDLFVKYIGNIDGENRFLNHENKIFPTIAPFQNINGLIETTKFDSDILFLSKYYYQNVMESIINYTKLILKMYDKNSVPYNGWMQSYVTFNGYTTKYEYSQKITSKIKIAEKVIDVDGPWSYSTLQKIYFDHFKDVNININNLTKYIDIIDQNKFDIKKLYSKYLIETKNNEDNLFFGSSSITGYVIDKIEYDMYNNSYTLLKNNDSLFGKLIFRSYEMLIGLPFYEFIEYDGKIDDLVSILNNCNDFGIIDDFIWVFGLNKNTNLYQVISFKFNYDYNHIKIDDNTLRYHSYNSNNFVDNLNDFVCTSFNEDRNEVNFIFIDQLNEIKKLAKDYNINLDNLNINFYINCLDLNTNDDYKFIFECKNIVLPLIFDDTQHKNEASKLTFISDHRIWKSQTLDITNYICYEALNVNEIEYFDYYRNFENYAINFQILNISWDVENIEFKDEKFFFSNNIRILNNGYNSLILNNALSEDERIKKIKNFMHEYPKCYIKNGHLNIDMIPYSTSEIYNDEIIDKIISSFINLNSNDDILTGYFNFNDYSILDDLLKNESDSKDIKKAYNDFKNCNDYLENIGFTNNFNEIFIDSNFNTDSDLIKLFKNIPNSKSCLFEPLKLTICYENENGISFINDFALDVDITCYINDSVERNKKVGYGNKFKETSYIKWSGDNNIEGNENLVIDVLKYIKNNNSDNKYDFDDELEIVLNTCWFNASEIKNGNIFIIINWQNIFEKIPIKIIGENGGRFNKSCETRSIIFKISKKYLTLSYDIPKQYFAFKYTLKESLNGIDDGVPDFQIGLINLSSNEMSNLKVNKDWKYFEDDNILLRVDEDEEKELKYITILLCNEYFEQSLESDLFRRTRKLLDEYQNIILKEDINHHILKIFEWKDLKLDEIYFGLYYYNIDKNTGINYFYYGYVNPKFYKSSTLKSAVISNYVLNLLKSKYPIMISIKEEIRNIMNNILI